MLFPWIYGRSRFDPLFSLLAGVNTQRRVEAVVGDSMGEVAEVGGELGGHSITGLALISHMLNQRVIALAKAGGTSRLGALRLIAAGEKS